MNTFRRIWALRKEPVVADHTLDIMSMVMWLLLGLWGILSTVQHVTILNRAIEWYPILWGSVIALSAWVAFIGAMMLFLVNQQDYSSRIFWKKVELMGVTGLLGFISVYPALMAVALFGDSPRVDLLVLSFTYLLLPLWRVGHLRERIKHLRLLRAANESPA